MKDYTATLTLTFSYQAQNEEQAQERAELLAEHLALNAPKPVRPWWPDMEAPEVEVEEA